MNNRHVPRAMLGSLLLPLASIAVAQQATPPDNLLRAATEAQAAAAQPVRVLNGGEVRDTASPNTMSNVTENEDSAGEAPSLVLQPEELRKRVARYGRIINEIPMQTPWLFSWLVERNGYQTTIYATPDGALIFAGVQLNGSDVQQAPPTIIDRLKGARPSAQHSSAASANVAQAPEPSVTEPPRDDANSSRNHASATDSTPAKALTHAMQGNFDKPVPEVINVADTLTAFKEGDGTKGDTVYMFFDPRCPYCREAYNKTRSLVRSGRVTIKWIPVPILKDPTDPRRGERLAATIIQNRDPAFLERVLGRKEDIQSPPAPETLQALQDNQRFMEIVFRYDKRETIGVPAALYVDHRDGKARLVTGVTEQPIFADIFGES